MNDAQRHSLWMQFLKTGRPPIEFEDWIFNEIDLPLLKKTFRNPEDEIHWEPEEGEPYFWIHYNSEVYESEGFEGEYEHSQRLIETGNIYRTAEEAEARVALRKHIVSMNRKYGRHGEKLRVLHSQGNELVWSAVSLLHPIKWGIAYDRPDCIHIDSDWEERAKRLRLIKAVYEKESDGRHLL